MEKLYLTAILPPADLYEAIDDIRKECAEKFGVKAALKPPVHVTLHRPFKLNEDRESQLIKSLSPLKYNRNPFALQIENFDTFDSKVVFIHVHKSDELSKLQKEISAIYRHYEFDNEEGKQPFHPHITIAYRDIPFRLFPELWEEYKNKKFKRLWHVDHFTLLKHDGQRWQRHAEFQFQRADTPTLF